ncbi:leucyl aminopeptidase family protein [Candidatus Uhrbacteria bacterium]|nr:leucyl aminopeptidase family protein [Candidatus Uhrbacteria bacterium]
MRHRALSLKKPITDQKAAFVLCLFEGAACDKHPLFQFLAPRDREYLSSASKEWKSELYASDLFRMPSSGRSVLMFGLGTKEKWNARFAERSMRSVVMSAKKRRLSKLVVVANDFALSGEGESTRAEHCAANAEIGAYEFNTFLTAPDGGWPSIKEILYAAHEMEGMNHALSVGSLIGERVNEVRELANTPGGRMTPKLLAAHAKKNGKKYGFLVKALGEQHMKKLGMGGVLGVSSGSAEEAQFIIMEYHGTKKKGNPLVFIGKGITFDSGGLQIKPDRYMDEMHMDMSGGASVIGALSAIAALKLPLNCVGIVPAAENMPSGSSYRPGDVLKTLSGKTVEVGHTDAEGRVVLTDALTYAERYEPSLVVDVATLTGAATVVMGRYASLVMSPQKKCADFMLSCGDTSGDTLWQLPLWDDYESHIKGYTGDVTNNSRHREAGTIIGGMFLYQFAKKFPAWAHVDIAATMTGKDDLFLSRGASGIGTRLLIQIARSYHNFTNS